jgi:tetratricopeptide (TPR) repeat protein
MHESATQPLAAGIEAMVEAAFRGGDYGAAAELLESARASAGVVGDRRTEAAAVDRLAMLMHFEALDRGLATADSDAEEALFQQALAIRRELGDRAGIAESLFGVGLVHQVLRRDWATAIPYFREALAVAGDQADPITRSEIHRHIGFFHLVEGDGPAEAIPHLEASLALREQHGDPRWIPSGLLALGQAELMAGQPAAAVEHLREAVRQSREVGLTPRRIEVAQEWLGKAEAGEVPELR